MTQNILHVINTTAKNIKEEDLDIYIIPELMEYYNKKINSLAFRAYGTNNSVSLAAFKERSKEILRSGLCTFLFKSEHWKQGRDINSYLLTCLNFLADKLRYDSVNIKRVNIPICPGCKYLGVKEYINYEGKLLRCNNCTKELERLCFEIKNISNINDKQIIEQQIQIHKSFSLHSKKGLKCNDCKHFIPISYSYITNISCPYPDCVFFGKVNDLKSMTHPVALGLQNNFSLDIACRKDSENNNTKTWKDTLVSKEVNADVQIASSEKFNSELELTKNIIETQKSRVKNNGLSATCIQKTLMYQAYLNILLKFPEEMVSYLVHLKQNPEFPIQFQIFQEYVSLIRDALPLTIVKAGNTININSLLDPNLKLFAGTSKFEAIVQLDKSIPNNTIETYIGGRKAKCYGQCFLGMITDIINKSTGESIIHNMEQYSFVKIKMDESIVPGTLVEVTHFRLIPHYEMGNLIYLQRIRRKIVDSIYFKLNGKQRETRK